MIKNYFIAPGLYKKSIVNDFNKIINYFEVNKKDVLDFKKDNRLINEIRQKICFFLYLQNYSYNSIKEVMNRKTHGNIIYHYKTVKGRIEVDNNYKQEIEKEYLNLYNVSLSTIL